MQILGLSAFYHDSAAALVRDGEILAAAQEERFTRKKHDSAFPINAVEYCLAAAGTTAEQIDHVAFYDKPFLKFERLLETYVAFAPRGFRSFSGSDSGGRTSCRAGDEERQRFAPIFRAPVNSPVFPSYQGSPLARKPPAT